MNDKARELMTEINLKKGCLIPVPLFHITGIMIGVLNAMGGIKVVFMRKWQVEEAAKYEPQTS